MPRREKIAQGGGNFARAGQNNSSPLTNFSSTPLSPLMHFESTKDMTVNKQIKILSFNYVYFMITS